MSFKMIATVATVFLILGCTDQKAANRAIPEKRAERYVITVGGQRMEIDPATGGRITSLTLNGKDFLTGSEVNDFNWGSTFWPSPQSEWNWPPSAALDNEPYTAEVENNELVMVSRKDSATGLVVTKKFSGNKNTGSYTLKYTITNRSRNNTKVAPWEVTRVHINGLAFFPMGDGERRGGLMPLTAEKDGIIWFTYEEDKLPSEGDRQLYTDGAEGWVAQLNNGVVLVKKFPDISVERTAPEEGEVELYASPVKPGKSYVEIENQGAYEELPPDASLTWEVTWFLRKLPPAVKPEAGDPSLVAYVRELVGTE